MYSTVYSGALRGVEAVSVQVEAKSGMLGDFAMIVVGLPDAAVKESSDRVTAAFSSCKLSLPFSKTIINLAPGDIRKEGPIYDLPIALSLLVANGTLPPECLERFVVAGELGLDGVVRPIRGGVSLALLARKQGRDVILPRVSAEEAALVEGVNVYPVEDLTECLKFLKGEKAIVPLTPESSSFAKSVPAESLLDFSEVKGQYQLRRAVEIAVAGAHNLLMIGSPGSGKSMIAKRIPTILPEPDLDEFLEILGIQSAAGMTIVGDEHGIQRPFRSPHHTISDVGLIGGGSVPGPGEISLAHNGVLFLDEFPEFKRSVLEVLRQPLEDGEVTISRASAKITLPAHFMLVAAMNPCPCGYYGDRHHRCTCTPTQIQRYRSRLSGPLLDRIDIHVNAPTLSIEELRTAKPGESSATMRARIVAARAVQEKRFSQDASMGPKTRCNARMTNRQIQKYCELGEMQSRMLQMAMERFGLSARAYSRILKVARTIADLAGHESIEAPDISEAINFRLLDKANEQI
ncbi:MAG: YifB family Mg chelatase-like AAA ATPase [Opitutales bacterium]|nr:YifB family Mg chelatase-like AAA ATPase [Opitutales bacterium]